MQAKVWGHRVWISLSSVVIVTETLCPSYPLFVYIPEKLCPSKPLFVYIPEKLCPSKQLFVYIPETLWPSYPMFIYKTKTFFPPFHFHFPCYCFDFVIENGGCWKEGHKAADLGILAWRFSNENEGLRRLEQNKIGFD